LLRTNVKSLEEKLAQLQAENAELFRNKELLEVEVKEQVALAESLTGKHNESKSNCSELLHELLLSTRPQNLLDHRGQILFSYPEICSRLHHEMLLFEAAATEFNIQAKPLYENLLTELHQAVREVVPGAECCVYGSFATDLSLPWSDIDLAIKIPSGSEAGNALNQLDVHLKAKKWVNDSKYIKAASMPLLKVTTCWEGRMKRFDITILDGRHTGLKCVDTVKNLLTHYPTLRPLALAVKQILQSLNYKDPYLVTSSTPF
jgi:predicted nucleotidyltransferase